MTQAAPSSSPRLLLGCLLLMGLVGIALYWVDAEQLRYARGVEQLLREPALHVNRPLRVQGLLVPGSLERGEGFSLELHDERAASADAFTQGLRVECARCELPGTLCDLQGSELPLAAEGELVQRPHGLVFAAEQVWASCPTRYDVQGAREQCARASPAERAACPMCRAGDPAGY